MFKSITDSKLSFNTDAKYQYTVSDSHLLSKDIQVFIRAGYTGLRFTKTVALISFYHGRGPVVPNLVRYYETQGIKTFIKWMRDGSMSESILNHSPDSHFEKYAKCLLRALNDKESEMAIAI